MNKLVGPKGLYLSLCNYMKMNPAPIKVPIFGLIRTYHEIRNIRDNFVEDRLRYKKVESYISKKQRPCIIDCGINVGITVRWWFYLNAQAKVFGVDMMKEAHEFTTDAMKSIGPGPYEYKSVLAALWGEDGKELKFGVTDPLYGDYGFYRQDKEATERVVFTRTLDSIFNPEKIDEVDLLKIDIEGAAADALKGATSLLKKTKYVVFEIHDIYNDKECGEASKLLSDSGFYLRWVTGKNLWWEKV